MNSYGLFRSYLSAMVKLLNNLFTTDYEIMSITVIAFTLGMAVFFIRYFRHKMGEMLPEVPSLE